MKYSNTVRIKIYESRLTQAKYLAEVSFCKTIWYWKKGVYYVKLMHQTAPNFQLSFIIINETSDAQQFPL